MIDELPETEIEQLPLAEAIRRNAALDAGAPSHPADDAIAHARRVAAATRASTPQRRGTPGEPGEESCDD